ncbi:hypothetical protein [Rhizobium sp. MHM7A]|nr:hypothetical protein [Rhizobium sp. MHM7A]
MISLEGIEWAINREREILLGLDTSERTVVPNSFHFAKGSAGYVISKS